MSERRKLIILLILMASFLPVWSCGMRKKLTFWQFILEHTVWGHPVQYIPEENYKEALA